MILGALSYRPIPIVELGPLNLSLHGVFAGLGFAAGAWLMVREAGRRGFDTEKVLSALSWALVGAIIGARIFTVPAHIGSAGYGLSDIVDISGDYSILGGFAGGIIVGLWRARMLGLRMLPALDMAAPGLAIGTVVGRIGDLAIVEHLGSETSFFLGYTIKAGYDVAPQHDILECAVGVCGTYHHTALYDLLAAAVLLGVIYVLRAGWMQRKYGQLFSVWAIWYGLQRFVIDFARLDAAEGKSGAVADQVMGPFTGSQWGALGIAVLGLALFRWFGRGKTVSAEHDLEFGAEPLEPAGATSEP